MEMLESEEGIIVILDGNVQSETLCKHFQDESNELRCDWLLANSIDFSSYYSMNEFTSVIQFFKTNRFYNQIILKAVAYYPFVVSMCPNEIMTKEFVRELIRRNVYCFNFLDVNYYKGEREILLNIIANPGYCEILEKVSDELQNDKSFILDALAWNNKCYFYLNERMKKDREIVLQVVSKDGYLLGESEFKEFTSDKEIVMAAVKSTNTAIMFASSKLKEDGEFFKNDVLPCNASLFKYAHILLRNDRTYISELIAQFPQCIEYSSNNIQGDVDYILELVKINPRVVSYLNGSILSTQNTIKLAKYDLPYQLISSIYEAIDDMYALDSFVLKSIERDPRTLKLFKLHTNCLQVVEHAIRLNGLALEYADHSIRMEKEIVRKACKQNPNSFKFASPILKQDLNFVVELMSEINPSIIIHASLKPETQKGLIAKFLVSYPKLLKDVYW